MTQSQFSEALGIYAGLQAREAQQIKATRDSQIAKLGPGASARVDAVNAFIDATAPKDIAGDVKNMLVTEKVVRYFESLTQKFQNQGGGDFSQAHREQGQPNGKIPGYETMTFEQRRQAQDNARRSAGK